MPGPVYGQVDDELQRRVDALRQVLRQPPRNRGPEGPREGLPGDPAFNGPPEDQRPRDLAGEISVETSKARGSFTCRRCRPTFLMRRIPTVFIT